MSYVSLHNHTEYSNLRLLDCTNKLTDLIDRAVAMGLKGLAITDHESLSGHIKAMNYVKEGKEKGKIPEDFVLACGNEIYLTSDKELYLENYKSGETKYYHFILIAKDKKGHELLRKLSTQAWKNRYRTGKMERVPISKRQVERIIGDDKGHLIGSTACIGSETADCILRNDQESAWEFIQWCQRVFGKDDFYLEFQPNTSEEQVRVNKALVSIGNNLGIKWIITTDTHYLSKELAPIHAAYLRSRDNGDREVETFYESCYLMGEDEIYERMDYLDGEVIKVGLENTLTIADKIEEYDLYHSQVVPSIEIKPFTLRHLFREWYDKYPYIKCYSESEYECDRYWLKLIEDGYEYRVNNYHDEARISRINDELRALWKISEKIHDRLSNYYITFLDIKDMMWDDGPDGGNSIVGPGRGSVAAFYICYLTGVHCVDSFKLNIPYWRHLEESREELPDVDVDTASNRRKRILEATKKKFGEERVLNICAFKTEGPRSAILTAARGLGIPIEEAESLSNMIPVKRGFTTPLSVMIYGKEEENIKPDKTFIDTCNGLNPLLLNYATSLEGLVSGRTVHASGVIIFPHDYTEFNSMMTAPNGQPTTIWEMNDSTYTGGLKFDYLTVSNLDIIQQCLMYLVEYGYIEWQGNLRKTYEKYFSPEVLDYDNDKMWQMMWNGEIPDLFQFCTVQGMETIKKVKPHSLIELGLANALERLMAQDGDTEQPVDKYVRYKANEHEWIKCMEEYGLNEDEMNVIRKYLGPACGVSTMQEDIMQLSMDEHISGFTAVEAGKLRKSVAKKSKKLQEAIMEKFYRKGSELGTRKNLLDYVADQCIKPQLG